MRPKKIGFIGGGNMAEALIKGLHAGGFPTADITVAEPVADRRDYLNERYGVVVTEDNLTVGYDCDAIILAIKPQVASRVLTDLSGALTAGKRLISIMAGVTTAAIEAAIPAGVRVVRVMPNTPALVLEGATAIAAGGTADHEDLALARRIFELVGKTCQVEERLMDAVTGLSGSGPAYAFIMIDALSDGGVLMGLPRDVALKLAAQTILGAAKLYLDSLKHPGELRDMVTSPGGTTIAGIHALEKYGLRSSLIHAVEAATLRPKELGKGK